jgi:hypothetical protein
MIYLIVLSIYQYMERVLVVTLIRGRRESATFLREEVDFKPRKAQLQRLRQRCPSTVEPCPALPMGSRRVSQINNFIGN